MFGPSLFYSLISLPLHICPVQDAMAKMAQDVINS